MTRSICAERPYTFANILRILRCGNVKSEVDSSEQRFVWVQLICLIDGPEAIEIRVISAETIWAVPRLVRRQALVKSRL